MATTRRVLVARAGPTSVEDPHIDDYRGRNVPPPVVHPQASPTQPPSPPVVHHPTAPTPPPSSPLVHRRTTPAQPPSSSVVQHQTDAQTSGDDIEKSGGGATGNQASSAKKELACPEKRAASPTAGACGTDDQMVSLTTVVYEPGNEASILVQPEGYEYTFVPRPDSRYECCICMLVMRDPYQTKCGHRFCNNCIRQWLR